MKEVLATGNVAVVAGAANGIGAATARALSQRGMKLALFDTDRDALSEAAKTLGTDLIRVAGDVTDPDDLQRLREATIDRLGEVSLLVNSVGIIGGAGPWDDPASWKRQLEVNLFGAVAVHHAFVPGMLQSTKPAAIVNLGSKEGITTPPGNAAYSVAKAGLKVVTEQLEHELRNVTEGRVSAHLLIPGYTWTPMNASLKPKGTEKPEEAWSADELVEYFLARLSEEDFYIICPDNSVTSEMDRKRIQWAADDMIRNRPALSRWHPDFAGEFADWMKS